MSIPQLNRVGLKSKIKAGFKYFIIPLQNIKIEANNSKTKTIWNGSFTISNNNTPFNQWIIKPATGDEISRDSLNFKKIGKIHYIYIFFSSDDVEKGMHINTESMNQDEHISHKHAKCKNHCIKWPDCAINLANGISWCWYELKNNPPLNDSNRFCNGQGKSYLNGDGYNCSYFLGLRQCR